MTLQRASAPRPDVHASGRLSLGFARPAPEHPDRRERPRPTVPRRARGRRSATAPKRRCPTGERWSSPASSATHRGGHTQEPGGRQWATPSGHQHPGRSAIPDRACSGPSRRGRFWHRRAACAYRDFWATLPISEWRGSPKSGAGWRDRACVILFGSNRLAMKPLSDHASFSDRARSGLRNVLLRPRRHDFASAAQ